MVSYSVETNYNKLLRNGFMKSLIIISETGNYIMANKEVTGASSCSFNSVVLQTFNNNVVMFRLKEVHGEVDVVLSWLPDWWNRQNR